jgi:ABC-2 type transport system ATP-binding protein
VIDGGQVIANDTPEHLKSQLGDTVVEMGFSVEAIAERAAGVLAGVVPGVDREGVNVRVSSDRGAHVLVEVLRSLDAEQLEPATLTVREPSLDDVFLALTGRHAEPTGEGVDSQPTDASRGAA